MYIHIYTYMNIHIYIHTHTLFLLPPPRYLHKHLQNQKNQKKKEKKYLAHPALQSDPTSGKNPRPPPDTCPLPSRTPAAPPGAVRLICFLKN